MRAMLFSLLLFACSSDVSFTIPQSVLQSQLSQRFPRDAGSSALQVTVSDPVLTLPGSTVELEAKVTVQHADIAKVDVKTAMEGAGLGAAALGLLTKVLDAPTVTREGSVEVAGVLSYDNELSAFYFRELKVSHFELDGVSDEHSALAASLVQTVVGESLDSVPAYVLEGDRKKAVVGLVLKDLVAEEGGLRVTLGK
jgi:hypothetical protein